jgi:hypothetical protein
MKDMQRDLTFTRGFHLEVGSLEEFIEGLQEDTRHALNFAEWDSDMLVDVFGCVFYFVYPEHRSNVYVIQQKGVDPTQTLYVHVSGHGHIFKIDARPATTLAIIRDLLRHQPGRYTVHVGWSETKRRMLAMPRVLIEDILSLQTASVVLDTAGYVSSGRPCQRGPTEIYLREFSKERSSCFTVRVWEALSRYVCNNSVTVLDTSMCLSRADEMRIVKMLESTSALCHLRIRGKSSRSFAARVVEATGHLPFMHIVLSGDLTPSQARQIASALTGRRCQLRKLEIAGAGLTDKDNAVILNTALEHDAICKYESNDRLGDECVRVLGAIMRKNAPNGLRVFKNQSVMWRHWPVILQSIAYTTSLRLLTAFTPPDYDPKPYVAHIDEWRVLGYEGMHDAPKGTGVYLPGDPPPGKPLDRAVVHGKTPAELDAFMDLLPASLHSLAVGQTDMSGGIPGAILTKPIVRLALFNCNIFVEPPVSSQVRRVQVDV